MGIEINKGWCNRCESVGRTVADFSLQIGERKQNIALCVSCLGDIIVPMLARLSVDDLLMVAKGIADDICEERERLPAQQNKGA